MGAARKLLSIRESMLPEDVELFAINVYRVVSREEVKVCGNCIALGRLALRPVWQLRTMLRSSKPTKGDWPITASPQRHVVGRQPTEQNRLPLVLWVLGEPRSVRFPMQTRDLSMHAKGDQPITDIDTRPNPVVVLLVSLPVQDHGGHRTHPVVALYYTPQAC
jgi:hypothetical protein